MLQEFRRVSDFQIKGKIRQDNCHTLLRIQTSPVLQETYLMLKIVEPQSEQRKKCKLS